MRPLNSHVHALRCYKNIVIIINKNTYAHTYTLQVGSSFTGQHATVIVVRVFLCCAIATLLFAKVQLLVVLDAK